MPEAKRLCTRRRSSTFGEHVKPFAASVESSVAIASDGGSTRTPRPEMRAALAGLDRLHRDSALTKHRLFVWLRRDTLPDQPARSPFARDDDYTFGVLHSRVHEALGPRARAPSCARSSPASATRRPPASRRSRSRARPTSSARRSPRPPAISSASATAGSTRPASPDAELAKRTLTNLYNAAPDLARERPRPPRRRRPRRLRLAADIADDDPGTPSRPQPEREPA